MLCEIMLDLDHHNWKQDFDIGQPPSLTLSGHPVGSGSGMRKERTREGVEKAIRSCRTKTEKTKLGGIKHFPARHSDDDSDNNVDGHREKLFNTTMEKQEFNIIDGE